MELLKYIFPKILFITGQSGSGKGTVRKIIVKICEELGLSVLSLSTGDLIRECIESDTPYARKMKALYEMGGLTPEFIADALVLSKILSLTDEYDVIIIDGGPRSVREVQNISAWLQSGFFDSMEVLEVISPDRFCRHRLFERTKIDHRLDLSVDGSPGIPSEEKIETKMDWWTRAVDEIRKYLKHYRLYKSIENDGDIESLEHDLRTQFLQNAHT